MQSFVHSLLQLTNLHSTNISSNDMAAIGSYYQGDEIKSFILLQQQ